MPEEYREVDVILDNDLMGSITLPLPEKFFALDMPISLEIGGYRYIREDLA